MEYQINIGGRMLTLEHEDFEDRINLDDLTVIDTSNLFGEAVTISAAVNRLGLMKAEVESTMNLIKLEKKIFEGSFKADLRKQAARNAGKYKIEVEGSVVEVKLTEKALDTCYETDSDWIKLQEQFIQYEKYWNYLDVTYWAAQDKSKKLNGLVSSTTPEDFVARVIEGKFNGVTITK
jgi:hypothetical protein